MAKDIAKQTLKDPVLSQALLYTSNGWPNHCPSEELSLFFSKSTELNILNGCLMWGMRVVIPASLQNKILTELHKDHTGIVKMKMMARSYFWWPHLDKAIEEISKSCPDCAQQSNVPAKAPVHPWTWPAKPWERVHLDFAGPFMGYNFLIAIDAHSKWPEVAIMNSTTAEKTINVLQSLLARYGIPVHLATDNGTQFTSEMFDDFCKTYGIKHTYSAPFHPATNGQVERFIQTFKQTLKKKANDKSTVFERVNQLLFSYRSTPHIATHQTPARLFLGREMRVRLDLLRPSVESTVQVYQEKMITPKKACRSLQVGQSVLARNYVGSKKWVPATITSNTGFYSYSVMLPNGKIWKRHIDQLLEGPSSSENDDNHEDINPGDSVTSGSGTKPWVFAKPSVEPTILAGPSQQSQNQQVMVPQTILPHRYPQRVHKAPKRLS